MKRLLTLAVVLAFATAADATVLSWSADAITINNINDTVVVTLDADDAQEYAAAKWVGHTPASPQIASIVNIVALPEAGGDAVVQNPSQTTFDEWWTVSAKGTIPIPIWSYSQFSVTIKGLAAGTDSLQSDVYGTNDILEVTVLPEPATAVLLALGSLGLLGKRRR